MSPDPIPPFIPRDLQLKDLERSLRRPRALLNFILSFIATLLTILAAVPLFSVLYMLIVRGGSRLSLELFTSLPPTGLDQGGGFGNAIVGTLLIVSIATLISVPFGILAAIYLAEVGPESKLAAFVRFSAKVLSGFPSILAGVFAYGTVVLVFKDFSAFAGGVALSVLMLPTVLLTAEEAIRMVPAKMREAAFGMGATQSQVVWKVLVPTAWPGILTGVMLSVARAAGETAPLLFTALFSYDWPWPIAPSSSGDLVDLNPERLMEKTPSLAVLIYNFHGSPVDNQVELAWAAALILVILVLVTNLVGQSISRKAIH